LRLHLGSERFHDLTAQAWSQRLDKERLALSLDAALEDSATHDERVGFLRQLGYRDSLLSGVQLALLLQSLAKLDDGVLDTVSLANLYAHRGATPLPTPPPLPAAVKTLLEGLIACEFDLRKQHAEATKEFHLYDPCAGTGELVLLAQQVSSAMHITACTADFAQALFLPLACWQEGITSDVQACAALNTPLPTCRAQFVVSFLPLDEGRWTDGVPDTEDSRWVFGPPSPTRPHYAWIQQAISMMDEHASALLLVPDAILHTDAPAEILLRERLAQSGLIKAVIALPGRLFVGRQEPVSIVLMEKSNSFLLKEILFVDAQNLGCELATTPGQRVLSSAAVERILDVCQRHGCGTLNNFQDAPDTDGFARVVSLSEVEAQKNLLTPWTYLRQQSAHTEYHLPVNPATRYRDLQTQRLKAQSKLNSYLKALSSPLS
jgi:type I restriction-modification system DNA methylase subunit